MGMFDYINYEGHEYQTKDTPAQACDNYKIENNILWYENYDAEWIEEEGFFGGHLKKFNERWDMCDKFDGLIRFYRAALENKHESWKQDAWIEYKALFMDGKMIKIEKINE